MKIGSLYKNSINPYYLAIINLFASFLALSLTLLSFRFDVTHPPWPPIILWAARASTAVLFITLSCCILARNHARLILFIFLNILIAATIASSVYLTILGYGDVYTQAMAFTVASFSFVGLLSTQSTTSNISGLHAASLTGAAIGKIYANKLSQNVLLSLKTLVVATSGLFVQYFRLKIGTFQNAGVVVLLCNIVVTAVPFAIAILIFRGKRMGRILLSSILHALVLVIAIAVIHRIADSNNSVAQNMALAGGAVFIITFLATGIISLHSQRYRFTSR